MHTAHFAAALAIRSRVPRAPFFPLLVGAFLCDFIWVGLGLAGVEPSGKENWFSDWSHSLLMTAVYSTLFAALFWRRERTIALAIWAASFSHFFLDILHPEPLGLYPHSSIRLGWSFWNIGLVSYWWIETAVVLLLLGVYVHSARARMGHVTFGRIAAACAPTCSVLGAVHALRLYLFIVDPS